jgi:hypothetical protein
MNLGIHKALNKRRCGIHYTCKNVAEHYIGDKDKPQDPHNYYLCDEHLELLYQELSKRYSDGLKRSLDEQNNVGNIKGQSAIKDYLTALYDNNGVISKAKMVEICQKHGIDLPEETPNMKTLMEMLFMDELKS